MTTNSLITDQGNRLPVTPARKTARKTASPSELLIGMEKILEITETAIFSAHLTKTVPISLILIGPSGAGKSKLVGQYEDVNGAHLTTDITSSGLQELLSGDPAGEIKFLIIPDFNVVLSHRASTLQLTIANLLSVTSEGTVRIDDGRVKKEVKHAPTGILTAMTRELYAHVAAKWAMLGFNRRFLPIYYEYSLETRQRIQASIMAGSVTLLQLARKQMPLPRNPRDVQISVQMAQRIGIVSDELSSNIGWIPHTKKKGGASFLGKQLEFSPHLALRAMARAHAMRDNRQTVDDSDLKFLMSLIEFTRYDRPGVL